MRCVWLATPVVALSFVVVIAGCHADTGFECGTPLPSDNSVIRTCDRPHEVCVCATNSCAKQETPTKDCPSGLRYVERPFISTDVQEGECVEQALTGWTVGQDATDKLCSSAAADAASDTGDAADDEGSSTDDGETSPSDADTDAVDGEAGT